MNSSVFPLPLPKVAAKEYVDQLISKHLEEGSADDMEYWKFSLKAIENSPPLLNR